MTHWAVLIVETTLVQVSLQRCCHLSMCICCSY